MLWIKTFLQNQAPDFEARLDQNFVANDFPKKRNVGDAVDDGLQHQDVGVLVWKAGKIIRKSCYLASHDPRQMILSATCVATSLP